MLAILLGFTNSTNDDGDLVSPLMKAETDPTDATGTCVRGLAESSLVTSGAAAESRRSLLVACAEVLAVARREAGAMAVTLVVLERVHSAAGCTPSEGAGTLVVTGGSALET